MINLKNTFFLCLFACLLTVGCKKKKDDIETPNPITNNPVLSGYYIKGNINGTLVETTDGQNDYEIVDANSSASAFGGGLNTSYTCSFQKLTLSNEKYFELSYSDNYIADSDDSDELQNLITVGIDSLVDGGSPFYSFYYHDENGKQYQADPNATKIAIQIESVEDLGKQAIPSLLGGSTNKRVVKVKGKILSGRLYEYSFGSGFSSNYVDVTNLDFVIRFTSAEEMP